MFIHNWANYCDQEYYWHCEICGKEIFRFLEEYVHQYPIAATEYAQELFRNHPCEIEE